MKSIKTGLVVVVMLVVVYGVWRMINKKPIGPPADLAAWTGELDISPPGGVSQIAPPQVPGSQPGDVHPAGGAVMPALTQPPPVALVPGHTNPADAHPYGSHHGHGAPVITPPQPAPVVGPGHAAVGASSVYGGGTAANRSIYGQSDSHAASEATSASGVTSASGTTSASGATSAWGTGGTANTWNAGETANAPTSHTRFDTAWTRTQEQLGRGELAAALAELSVWYGSKDIPADKQQAMTELLDQLAGAVVYSRDHLLEQPYIVQSGETLQDIALTYQVPWQLLANINGISDPALLTPGTPLKVVRGPFNALISLDRKELTLIVAGRYAGRFSIALGNDPVPRTGEFNVREKEVEKEFIDRDGRTIPPGRDGNPYGPYWIGLDGPMGIHGAPTWINDRPHASTGSIIVTPDDARDLFAILSEDSRVIIRR